MFTVANAEWKRLGALHEALVLFELGTDSTIKLIGKSVMRRKGGKFVGKLHF